MYQHRVEPFGNFEKHTLENELGDAFAIVPQFGANLLNLQFSGTSVLDGYNTPEELNATKWSKNIFLFPYPNRLADGRYTHLGKTYQFDLNNPQTNNSIHGFSKDAEMQVSKVKIEDKKASITCLFKHKGKHKAYPFKFTCAITFILRGGNLEIKMKCTNTDKVPIPMGLGWHPYFKIAETSNETALKMPDCQLVVIDDRMLPTGEKQAYNAFQNLKKIKNTVLDTCFYITNQTKKAQVVLKSEAGALTYWQETGIGKWNFLQVFTPPHRQSIALEPMTCNVNAFNNQDGLIILPPKGVVEGKFGVKFQKK